MVTPGRCNNAELERVVHASTYMLDPCTSRSKLVHLELDNGEPKGMGYYRVRCFMVAGVNELTC